MRKQKENKRRLIKIASFLLLIIGISFIALEFLTKNKIKSEETKAIEEFYEQENIIKENKPKTEVKEKSLNVSSKQRTRNKSFYIAMLKIPKINVERGLVDPSSKYNDVKYNVEIIKGSDMPDKNNGNLILAGHSGTARISYFRNLNKLQQGDDIFIYYQGKKYNYKVVKIYEVDKTGTVKLLRNNKTTLTLVSCVHQEDKQIVVIAERE